MSAFAVTLAFAWATKAGPIVVVLGGPHGVHLGDLLVLWVSGGCALVASSAVANEQLAPARASAAS